jgi:hypothetical protein
MNRYVWHVFTLFILFLSLVLTAGCVKLSAVDSTTPNLPVPTSQAPAPGLNLQATQPVSPATSSPALSSPPPTPQSLNWSGTWYTDWGNMQLTQSTGSVTGTYTWESGKITGSISKNLTGNILYGTWSESPSYAPPKDAGDFEWTMSPDFNSFTGKWRYGSSGDWNGKWKGTRIK